MITRNGASTGCGLIVAQTCNRGTEQASPQPNLFWGLSWGQEEHRIDMSAPTSTKLDLGAVEKAKDGGKGTAKGKGKDSPSGTMSKKKASPRPGAAKAKQSPRPPAAGGSSAQPLGSTRGAGEKPKLKKSMSKKNVKGGTTSEPEPTVTATRPLVLRTGFELNSDKLGEVPPGTPLIVVETRDGDGGAKRALIRYVKPEAEGGGEQQGWVTSILKDGSSNFTPIAPLAADAAASAAGAGGAAGDKKSAFHVETSKAAAETASAPAGARRRRATPRQGRRLSSTPRKGGGGVAGAARRRPRAAPSGTPRAAPSGTPRRAAAAGGGDALAAVVQATAADGVPERAEGLPCDAGGEPARQEEGEARASVEHPTVPLPGTAASPPPPATRRRPRPRRPAGRAGPPPPPPKLEPLPPLPGEGALASRRASAPRATTCSRAVTRSRRRGPRRSSRSCCSTAATRGARS